MCCFLASLLSFLNQHYICCLNIVKKVVIFFSPSRNGAEKNPAMHRRFNAENPDILFVTIIAAGWIMRGDENSISGLLFLCVTVCVCGGEREEEEMRHSVMGPQKAAAEMSETALLHQRVLQNAPFFFPPLSPSPLLPLSLQYIYTLIPYLLPISLHSSSFIHAFGGGLCFDSACVLIVAKKNESNHWLITLSLCVKRRVF